MPFPYTDPFDATTPTAVEGLSNGDDRIRELKRAINERLADALNNWSGGGTVTPKIANLSILTAMLADDAVTQAKIADSAVGTLQILDDAVTAAKIAALAVGTPELADLGVTGAKLAADAVTDVKVATGINGSKISDLTLPGAKIVDRGVSSVKIALLAIITELIADSAVTTPKIADASVTAAKMAAAIISRAMLDAALKGEIAHKKSVDLAITAGSHATDTVTSVGTVALAGAAVGDAVHVGLPNTAAWTHAQRTNRWDARVTSAGTVELWVINMSGGNKDWPAFTAKLSIVKSLTDWGL